MWQIQAAIFLASLLPGVHGVLFSLSLSLVPERQQCRVSAVRAGSRTPLICSMPPSQPLMHAKRLAQRIAALVRDHYFTGMHSLRCVPKAQVNRGAPLQVMKAGAGAVGGNVRVITIKWEWEAVTDASDASNINT